MAQSRGWCGSERQAGRATPSGMGFDYVHSAVDDPSRLAYSKTHPDEKAAT